MSGPNETATIRRLPDGNAQRAVLRDLNGGRLEVIPDLDSGVFQPGELVEIQSPRAFYLGEVTGLQAGARLQVNIAHFIDRVSLSEIGKVWNTAEGE